MPHSRVFIVSGLCVAAAAVPAVASAATFEGKTRQGRLAQVVTLRDGRVRYVRIAWQAPCRHGRYRDIVRFVRPLDLNVPGRFRDGTPPVARVRLGNGLHARLKGSARGHVGAHGRWRGRFRVDVGVFRGSSRVDTCHLRNDTWTASRR
jgi:hypothetical protein